MKHLPIFLLGLVGFLSSIPCLAHDGMGAQLPNGGSFGCAMCHVGAGGSPMNCFGEQVRDSLSAGQVDWSALYDLDADGDGFTNGKELGDPSGTWRVGDADPDYPASKPFDADSTPCGNGLLEDSELCDGQDFGGLSCQTEGFVGGELSCVDQCSRIDTSACNLCGNDSIDDGEQCDGADLGGASCESLGFDGGQLSCTEDCTLDKSACSSAGPECGNGVREEGEDCDKDDLGDETCQGLGFDSGVLGCDQGTCRFDTSACVNDGQAVCGNGVRESTEQCDGDDLGGKTCKSLGYMNGTLGCVAELCRFDATDCNNDVEHTCGNGVREYGEECDGVDFGDSTCKSQGFGGGSLSCVDCKLDLSECTAVGEDDTAGGCATGASSGRQDPAGMMPFVFLILWGAKRMRLAG